VLTHMPIQAEVTPELGDRYLLDLHLTANFYIKFTASTSSSLKRTFSANYFRKFFSRSECYLVKQ
jgi:hypothetical protein